MSRSTQTRVTNKLPLPLDTRRTQSSRQWFLEAEEDARTPVFHHNRLSCFIGGEETFRHIAASIQRARTGIEIVCWGFDPAMELIRDQSHAWPRGETWASLLHGAAVGRWTDGRPVQVRILSWFDALGERAVANMPGYVDASMTPLDAAQQARLKSLLEPARTPSAQTASLSIAQKRRRRDEANRLWYTLVKSGQLESLSLRVRNGDAPAIQRLLSAQSMSLTLAERLGMERLGTYHQKTILIDYDDTREGARPKPQPVTTSAHQLPPQDRAHIPPGHTLQVPGPLASLARRSLAGFTAPLEDNTRPPGLAYAPAAGYWQARVLPENPCKACMEKAARSDSHLLLAHP